MTKTQRDNEYARTHLKRIPLNMQLTDYDALKTAATAQGEPVNTYIKRAIRERMERTAAADTAGEPVATYIKKAVKTRMGACK